jgi:putative aldouronate transport system substrate-binding protein
MSSRDILIPILHAFGIFSNTDTGYTPVLKDEKVVLANTTDEYKAFLKYMNRLFKEGLFDKDALIQADEDLRAKVREDRLGSFGTGGAPYVLASQPISYDKNFYCLAGITSSYNPTPVVVYNSPLSTNIVVAINKDTKYPEAICRLLDYLYDEEEGHIVGHAGFKGVSWDYTTFAYAPDYPIFTMRQPEGFGSAEEYRYKKAVINGGTSLLGMFKGTAYSMETEADDKLLSDERVLNAHGWSVRVEARRRECQSVDNFPLLSYTSEEAVERTSLVTDLDLYLKQSLTQFISGEVDIDSGWNDYLRTLDQMKASRLIAIDQAAYDRLK